MQIRENRIIAWNPVNTGVHLQGHGPFAEDGSRPRTIDGTRVEYNAVLTAAPSNHQFFGGIRVRDGSGVTVMGNQVVGLWQNAISIDDLQHSRFEQNSLHYSIQYGIVMGLSSPVVAGVRRNALDENTVEGVGEIGVWMVSGCCNAVRHNQMWRNGTDGIDGIRFSDETGGNVFIGDLDMVDAEAGEYDCDGDGALDPNVPIAG